MLGKTVECPHCRATFEAKRPPQGAIQVNFGILDVGVFCFRFLAMLSLLSALAFAVLFFIPTPEYIPASGFSKIPILIGVFGALLAVGCNLALAEALKVLVGLARANNLRLRENTSRSESA
jgi:hypothetical protein